MCIGFVTHVIWAGSMHFLHLLLVFSFQTFQHIQSPFPLACMNSLNFFKCPLLDFACVCTNTVNMSISTWHCLAGSIWPTDTRNHVCMGSQQVIPYQSCSNIGMLDYKWWHGITIWTLHATHITNLSCHIRTGIRNTTSLPSLGTRYNACIITVKKKIAENNVFIYSLIYLMIKMADGVISSGVSSHKFPKNRGNINEYVCNKCSVYETQLKEVLDELGSA